MNLTTYPDLLQGTDEWLHLRAGMVTASVVGKLITPKLATADNDTSRGVIATLAAERITGHIDQTYVSADMWRGVEDEPRARDAYSEHYAPVTECGFMVRHIAEVIPLGYSPDGLVGDNGLIECKSRQQKKHLQTIISGEVPAENMAQLQCGLLVSGREWIDYVSYCGGMPLWVKRIEPDPAWFDAITDATVTAYGQIAHIVNQWPFLTDGLPETARIEHEEIVI
ncbi:YqaJ-like recombinase protein [Branchiibius hedensis]|uniref:YqaJ-like recombinase domain-containing protein n=1 Tax=Branchiibius hedensis TaxID=672460 RepID=A0A2Y8ZK21_9MICO|nr:lambda exonuclease family protein [Branchiibius hedensis]PWJ22807.1 YqaJ-like recombinase protein [Branchiibius hedensis]PWJ23923.1 YqaJ-like recombinase protein [Branchiibius hedensis]SSA32741.1 YqaJ-like recombinase domain-containing protein [Branchiibius hedensis]SSA59156.1 YqaJ-like recombinase domain-containing protein [Branchiibius hedensis]